MFSFLRVELLSLVITLFNRKTFKELLNLSKVASPLTPPPTMHDGSAPVFSVNFGYCFHSFTFKVLNIILFYLFLIKEIQLSFKSSLGMSSSKGI